MGKITNTATWEKTGGEYAIDLDRRLKQSGKNPYVIQRKFALDALKKINFKTALEVGCNNGRILEPLFKHFPKRHIEGCDISREALDILQERCPKAELRKVNIVEGLPYKDNEFDLVYTSECLCHIAYYDIDKVRDELKRVAKKVIFLSEPFRPIYPDKHTVNVGSDSHGGTFCHHHEKYFDNCETDFMERIAKNYLITL